MKKMAVILSAVLGLAGLVHADTIYMNNGVRVQGIVKSQDEQKVIVAIGKRQVTLRANEVAEIEKNAETGVFDVEKAKVRAAARDQELLGLTGLTAQQRAEVEQILSMLILDDPHLREQGKRKLEAMGRSLNLFPYFQYTLPGMLPYAVPGVLEVLVALDPEQAKPMVRAEAESVDTVARASALALLGRIQDVESEGLIVRGLVDHMSEVRIAAASALAALKSKGATPALIEDLKAFDQRVQNASRDALRAIWNAPGTTEALSSAAEWQAFWRTQAASTPAFDVATLEPLVAPGTEFRDE